MIRACSRGPVRLLKRQLFHQAAAMFFVCLWTSVVMTWALLWSDKESDCLGLPDIPVIMDLFMQIRHGLWFGSWLVDLHIASSILAAALHSPRVLMELGRYLPVIWLLAAAYGFSVWMFSAKPEVIQEHDPIGAVIVALIFFVTFGLYLVAVVVSRRQSPNSVVRRMRDRAMVYPAIFIVTVFPTCLRYFDVKIFAPCSAPGVYSHMLQHATVTLNAVAFCMLSGTPLRSSEAEVAIRSVELSVIRSESGGGCLSSELSRRESTCNVGFKLDPEVLEITHGGSWRMAGQWSDEVHSFRRSESPELDDAGDTAGDSAGAQEATLEDEAAWRDYVGEEAYGWV